ncbi:hypothetical protein N1851_023568 [Merluccius polli]|uniref:Uncharacterized protein n=1 Tax=Merluccius polli TaxID=89951 RepID=A0AA47MG84_MERPO|nr:hypothetical protein N1851_023568 [Merluccius polli]
MACCCHRKHMKRLWMGQRGFLPDRLHLNINPASSMQSIKLSGDTAKQEVRPYLGNRLILTQTHDPFFERPNNFGYTITHLVHFVVLMIFVCLIIIPIRHGKILETLSMIGEAL